MPILEHEEILRFFLVIIAVIIAVLIALTLPNMFQVSIKPENACPLYNDKLAYYYSDIVYAIQKHGLSVPNAEALVAGLITQESNWKEDAKRYEAKIGDSSYGLMQIVPKFHPECDRERVINDPVYNIECGVGILARYISDCGGNIEQGLTKYNSGSCTGKTYDPQYVQKILSYQSAFMTCLP